MPECTPAELEAAVTNAADTYKDWRDEPITNRVRIMFKLQHLLKENMGELAALVRVSCRALVCVCVFCSVLFLLCVLLNAYAAMRTQPDDIPFWCPNRHPPRPSPTHHVRPGDGGER